MARFPSRRPAWLLLALLLPLAPIARAQAPEPVPQAAHLRELKRLLDTPDVRALLPLLADPAIRDALAAPRAEARAPPQAASLGARLAGGLADLRARLILLGEALPRLPGDLAATVSSMRTGADRSGLAITLDIAAFVLGGLLLQRGFWRATAGWRRHFDHAAFDTVAARLRVTSERLAFGVLMIAVYAAGSLGAFLLFTWSRPLGALILDALLALLAVRGAVLFGRFVFSPGAERVRLLPIPTPRAWLFYHATLVVTAEAAFGNRALGLLDQAGLSAEGHAALGALLALVLLATIGIAVILDARASHDSTARPRRVALAGASLFYLALAWFAFVGGGPELGWSMLLILAAPAIVRGAQQMTSTLVRGPAGADCTEAVHVYAVAAERAVRSLAAILIATLFAGIWHIDLAAFAEDGGGAGMQLLHGVVDAILIVLLADLLWHTLRAVIDRRLARALEEATDPAVASHAQTRARTLLPILRNVLLVTLVAIAALMALSAVGVQTAPLLAGAGVVGVAIGFGAQTLVRDILSGVFFLFDDAFRIGEYIESGPIKGTVEGFSLRSVRLRHYLGQLHTVPFGNLAQITNYSRDWSSEETRVLVGHDADLDAVEEAIAETSAALADDPLFQGVILDPLKSMGVTMVNEVGFAIGLIVRTRPGKQYAVRAAALGRLKKAFAARGIRFASIGLAGPAGLPTASVAHPPMAAQ